MDCKEFQSELPDLVLTPNATPSVAAVAHLRTCPPCTEDYVSFQQTFGLLDVWAPVEPTPYFDGRLQARVREVQAAPPMSFFERLQSRFLFNTGRNFRPAAAGAFALLLALGSGGALTLNHLSAAPQASATVNDLQILDRNAQAFQQMDELQQDEDNSNQPANVQDQSDSPTT